MHTTRTFLLLIFFLAGALGATCQERPLTILLANEAYANHDYRKAALLYERIANFRRVPTYVPGHLADCYWELNDYVGAARWYKKVTDQFPASGADWIRYGDALKSLGMYADAKVAYRHAPDSLYRKVLNRAEGCDSALAWIQQPSAWTVTNLASVNTENSDWGAVWYAPDVIVFTSDSLRRDALGADSNTVSRQLDKRTGRPFEKVYRIDGSPLGTDSISGFSEVVNGNTYHDGAIAFSPSGDTAWFSMTNPGSLKDPAERIRRKEGKRRVKIQLRHLELWYTVRDAEGKWGSAKSFPYNSRQYSVGQASLSRDGQVLYFTSDMPGGYGGTDIWYVTLSSDGSWSKPVNCGPLVNTPDDEAFPSIGVDGCLYFASKGHVGMGGFDIYRASGENDSWASVDNLGYPINSAGDDFCFTLKDSLSGFLSSDRPGGKGSDDIYTFGRPGTEPVIPYVATPRIAEPSDPVSLMTELALCVPPPPPPPPPAPEPEVTVAARKPPVRLKIVPPPPQPREHVLKTLVIDYLSGEPMARASVTIASADDAASTGTTGDDGVIYSDLDPGAKLRDSAALAGYTGTGVTFASTGLEKPDTLSVTIRLVKKPEAGDLFELRRIYFDFDRANIRKDAAVELDRLVDYMRKYPDVIIDLSAHTDSRGNDDYNQLLSERRASSARKYLLEHGIRLHRIIVHGYGESMPVNGCRIGVPCTEAEYQANRRIEIKILSTATEIAPPGT